MSIFKIMIKFIYTLLIPVLTVIAYLYMIFISKMDIDVYGYIIITSILIVVLVQSLLFFVFMEKVKMKPNVSTEYYMGIAFGIGSLNKGTAFICLPFFIIRFEWPLKRRRVDQYTT